MDFFPLADQKFRQRFTGMANMPYYPNQTTSFKQKIFIRKQIIILQYSWLGIMSSTYLYLMYKRVSCDTETRDNND